jgi:hypothetical protein
VTFKDSRAAIIRATAKFGYGYMAVEVVKQFADPATTIESLLADLGGMHDVGEVTLAGPVARFEGMIWTLPDGSFGTVVDSNRYIQNKINDILAEGYAAEQCS